LSKGCETVFPSVAFGQRGTENKVEWVKPAAGAMALAMAVHSRAL